MKAANPNHSQTTTSPQPSPSSIAALTRTAKKLVAVTEYTGRGWSLTLVYEALTFVTPAGESAALKREFETWAEKIKALPPKKWQRATNRKGFTACAWPRCSKPPTVVTAGDPLVFCEGHAVRQAEHSAYFEHLRQVKRGAKEIQEQDAIARATTTPVVVPQSMK